MIAYKSLGLDSERYVRQAIKEGFAVPAYNFNNMGRSGRSSLPVSRRSRR